MPTWPAAFCPLAGSLQESPPNNTIRTSMDRGPDKVRRRTTANIRPLAFRVLLTKAQVETLDAFFLDDTFSGADSFTFVHPRTGDTVDARFVSPPSYTHKSAGFYEASISLEILP